MIRTFLLVSIFTACFIRSASAQDNPPVPPPPMSDDEDKVFTRVEQEAEFPGGLEAWKNFLIKTLNADVAADHNAPAGKYTVIARFIVGKDGTLKEIETENKMGYGTDAEVIRVIGKSGKWIPAVQNGRPVNAYRRQPISFVVIDDDFEIKTPQLFTVIANQDNTLNVTAHKVNAKDIGLSTSEGTIEQTSPGIFVLKAKKPGRILLTVTNLKTNVLIGKAYFDVVNH